jgi:hypothetical protein
MRGSSQHTIFTIAPDYHRRAVGIRWIHASAVEESVLGVYIMISVVIRGCLRVRLRGRWYNVVEWLVYRAFLTQILNIFSAQVCCYITLL